MRSIGSGPVETAAQELPCHARSSLATEPSWPSRPPSYAPGKNRTCARGLGNHSSIHELRGQKGVFGGDSLCTNDPNVCPLYREGGPDSRLVLAAVGSERRRRGFDRSAVQASWPPRDFRQKIRRSRHMLRSAVERYYGPNDGDRRSADLHARAASVNTEVPEPIRTGAERTRDTTRMTTAWPGRMSRCTPSRHRARPLTTTMTTSSSSSTCSGGPSPGGQTRTVRSRSSVAPPQTGPRPSPSWRSTRLIARAPTAARGASGPPGRRREHRLRQPLRPARSSDLARRAAAWSHRSLDRS